MIITSLQPFTLDQIEKLKEQFDIYIKTVIDIEKRICVAGMDRHFEGEQLLLDNDSSQANIWGGGIDLETKTIDFNSFINIRPQDSNMGNEIQNEELRKKYEALTRWFFVEIL